VSIADVEGPQAPQKIETTLALPVEGVSVLGPVHFIVSVYSQVFIVLYNVHIAPLDHRCLVPPQIHNQFLRLCHVELQMVLLTLCDKAVHNSPALILITSAHTSNYGRVIRKLLKMAGVQ